MYTPHYTQAAAVSTHQYEDIWWWFLNL